MKMLLMTLLAISGLAGCATVYNEGELPYKAGVYRAEVLYETQHGKRALLTDLTDKKVIASPDMSLLTEEGKQSGAYGLLSMADYHWATVAYHISDIGMLGAPVFSMVLVPDNLEGKLDKGDLVDASILHPKDVSYTLYSSPSILRLVCKHDDYQCKRNSKRSLGKPTGVLVPDQRKQQELGLTYKRAKDLGVPQKALDYKLKD